MASDTPGWKGSEAANVDEKVEEPTVKVSNGTTDERKEKDGEDGADGGYSSNSCNGADENGEVDEEPMEEHGQDPFGEDDEHEEHVAQLNGLEGLDDTNTLETETDKDVHGELGEEITEFASHGVGGSEETGDVPEEFGGVTEDDEEGVDQTEPETDGSMTLKIGSVSSIQTVVHEDLSQWGAKLEAEAEGEVESEADVEAEVEFEADVEAEIEAEAETDADAEADTEVWEDNVEKEINDLNDREGTESDTEYDEAILKAMQESLARDKKGEKEKSSDDQDKEEDEMTLDGVPEVAETVGFEDDDEIEAEEPSNPLDDIDPYVEEDDYDPLNGGVDDIATDENTSGFLDQVNSGALPVLVDLPKQVGRPRGPYKKSRVLNSDDDYDEDEIDEYKPFDDEPGPKKTATTGKGTGNEVYFNCNICAFPFDTLGQMKIHKFGDHENEDRPSFLDLAEAAIMSKKNRKTGVSRNIMLQVNVDIPGDEYNPLLQEAMKDPSVTEPKAKAMYLLNKALKAGIGKGRLMLAKKQPKAGGPNYRLVSKPNRRKVGY